jgi:parallel beta-helix repeat protein
VLQFKTGAGKIICCVTEGVESFGIIKLDGTRSAADVLELRMLGDTAERRKIKLGKGAALLLYGRPNLPKDRRNVGLSSPKLPEQKEDLPSVVEAEGAVGIDWQRAYFQDVKLVAKRIDNTGAKQNERLNIIDNQFSGRGQVWCQSCDTPVISKNTIEYKGARLSLEGAITLSSCPLSEIKDNVIRGGFYVGIWFTYQSDAVLIGNTIENCTHGISGSFGIDNTIVKKCQMRGCDYGIVLQGGTAVVEDTLIEDSTLIGFQQATAQLQLTNCQIRNTSPKGVALNFKSGTLSLLNCNITPDQIKMEAPAAKTDAAAVTCLQYVVVGARKTPPNSLVDLRTAVPALSADAADPNVRNSPAPLVDGLSPLPRALNPLIVKAWTIDDKGKVLPPPEYTVKILGPAPEEGAVRPVLRAVAFRPQENALRATPADATPTLEVIWK